MTFKSSVAPTTTARVIVCSLLIAAATQSAHAACDATHTSLTGCPTNSFSPSSTISSSSMNTNFTDIWTFLNTNFTNGVVPLTAGGTGATSASTARTALGLGSVATLTVGTAANNVVQLDSSAKLPAVDGSQLTNVSAGASTGITLNSGMPASLPSAGQMQLVALSNILPVMTSNTAPSGTASASAFYNTGCDAWLAIAGISSGWLNNGGSTGWIQYQFPTAKVVYAYAITPWSVDSFPTRSPVTWTFQGSNNGSTWTTLDTQTSVSSSVWVLSTPKIFPTTNTTAYSYYKLNITANAGNGYTAIKQLKFYGDTQVQGDAALFLRSASGTLQTLSL